MRWWQMLAAVLLAVVPPLARASESATPIQFNDNSPPPQLAPPPPPAQPAPKTPRRPRRPAPLPEAADEGTPASRVASRAIFYVVHPADKEHKERTTWLLGSIHVASPATYPLASLVEKAFSSSRVLAVEADVRPARMKGPLNRLQRLGRYPAGSVRDLRTQLPAKCYAALTKAADELGLPAYQLNQMRPWFAALSLEMLEATAAGLRPELGIDLHFLNHAGSREVEELESVDAQLDLFSDMPVEQQGALVCSTAATAADFKSELKRLFAAWHAGDADGLQSIIDEDQRQTPELKPVLDSLLTERNQRMAQKIAAYLDSDEAHFVVVGAAHLVGPQGIVALLRAKGLVVEQE